MGYWVDREGRRFIVEASFDTGRQSKYWLRPQDGEPDFRCSAPPPGWGNPFGARSGARTAADWAALGISPEAPVPPAPESDTKADLAEIKALLVDIQSILLQLKGAGPNGVDPNEAT